MRTKSPEQAALYVRLPSTAVDKLHRAAEVLGVHKKDLVAGLVTRYVDLHDRRGLEALGQLSRNAGAPLGSYSFRPYELPEVLTAEQAGQFLQIPETAVLELAESGQLPGRKLGNVWRFSRAALVEWLSAPPGRAGRPGKRDP
jgi:excisionase family DNA binding protein